MKHFFFYKILKHRRIIRYLSSIIKTILCDLKAMKVGALRIIALKFGINRMNWLIRFILLFEFFIGEKKYLIFIISYGLKSLFVHLS